MVFRRANAGLDGLTVRPRLRRGAERGRIAGPDFGADDDICRPFSSAELLARMGASLGDIAGR